MSAQPRLVTVALFLFSLIFSLLPIPPAPTAAHPSMAIGAEQQPPTLRPRAQSHPVVYVHGQITDAQGQPAGNLRVRLILPDGRIDQEIITSADGFFRFAAVGTDAYQLWVIAPDGRPLVWEGDQLFSTVDAIQDAQAVHQIRLDRALPASRADLQANTKPAVTTPDIPAPSPAIVLSPELHMMGGTIPPRTNQFGQITGTVTAADTGQPLANVNITAYNAQEQPVNITSPHFDTGVYTLFLVEAGSYRLKFEPSGFGDTSGYLPEYYDDQIDLESANPVVVDVGTVVSEINAVLARGAEISGTVTTADTGLPMPFARVTLYDLNEKIVGSDSADATGGYLLTGLPAGQYKLKIDPSFSDHDEYFAEYYNNQGHFDNADIITLALAETRIINVALARAGTIVGTVSDADTNAPLNGVTVELYSLIGQRLTQQTPFVEGRYQFTGLQPGAYKLYANPNSLDYLAEYYSDKPDLESADEITVSTAQTTTVNIGLTRGARILGTVTDGVSNAVLENIEVALYNANADLIGQTTTTASGLYTFTALTGGSYYVRFGPIDDRTSTRYVHEYHNDKPTLRLADAVTVAPPDVQTINAVLTPAGRIAGSVTDVGTNAPLASIHVEAYDRRGVLRASTSTDGSGNYALTGLLQGSYWLYFEAPDSGPTATYGNQHLLDAVTVTPPNTVGNTNIRLTRLGQITGKVTAANTSSPMNNVLVQVYNDDGLFIDSTRTNVSGVYTTTGLTTGSYALYAGVHSSGSASGYQPTFYQNKTNLLLADRVQVTGPGLVTNINIALPSQVTASQTESPIAQDAYAQTSIITGTVTDAETGSPVAASIRLYNSAGVADQFTTSNALTGAYRFAGIEAGIYRLYVTTPSEPYIPSYWNNKPDLASATPITVGVGQTKADVNVALVKGGQVTGRVRDAVTGLSINSVTVEIYNVSTAQWVDSLRTDRSGRYTTSGLPNGTYRLRFSKTDDYLSTDYPDPIVIPAPIQVAGIDVDLQRSATILGRVMDEANQQPIGGVFTYIGECIYESYDTTNWLGLYALEGLTGGTYAVTYETDDDNASSPYLSTTVSGIRVDAPNELVNHQTLKRGGQILGILTAEDTAMPLPGVDVLLYNSQTRLERFIETNDAGAFAARGLPDGVYRLIFDPDEDGVSAPYIREYYDNQAAFTDAKTVTIAGLSKVTGINAVLARGAQIAGRVTAADTGLPLSGVDIAVVTASNNNWVAFGETDNDGNYVTSGVPTGDYRVFFRTYYDNRSAPYAYQFYTGKSFVAEGDLVSVTAPAITSGINAVLQQGSRITGRVTDKSNNPLDGVYIPVIDSSGTFVAYAFSDSGGTYATGGLPTGNYRVRFSYDRACTELRAESYYNNKPNLDAADSIVVTAPITVTNINTSLDITVAGTPTATPPGGSSGNPTATPVPGNNKTYLPHVSR